eukprot:TRINITY_DN12837_c0_g1_i12.p6 TRINITY_DN12837_c0_g1~~TRINITY_DN12837_c0_g1_i12.p6  ORF type:complete len:197 (+),score=-15.53 TRINITY_DN12837_c0_g1_i12:4668-5258(+)
MLCEQQFLLQYTLPKFRNHTQNFVTIHNNPQKQQNIPFIMLYTITTIPNHNRAPIQRLIFSKKKCFPLMIYPQLYNITAQNCRCQKMLTYLKINRNAIKCQQVFATKYFYLYLQRQLEITKTYIKPLQLYKSNISENYLKKQPFYQVYTCQNIMIYSFYDNLLEIAIFIKNVRTSNFALGSYDATQKPNWPLRGQI